MLSRIQVLGQKTHLRVAKNRPMQMPYRANPTQLAGRGLRLYYEI